MGRHALWRLIQAAPLLLLISLISFLLLYLIPGDPALVAAGPGASADVVAVSYTHLTLPTN